jgi:hypothetical protein
VCIFAVPVKF